MITSFYINVRHTHAPCQNSTVHSTGTIATRKREPQLDNVPRPSYVFDILFWMEEEATAQRHAFPPRNRRSSPEPAVTTTPSDSPPQVKQQLQIPARSMFARRSRSLSGRVQLLLMFQSRCSSCVISEGFESPTSLQLFERCTHELDAEYWRDLGQNSGFGGQILVDCIHRIHDDVEFPLFPSTTIDTRLRSCRGPTFLLK